jgi:hypothetical protein
MGKKAIWSAVAAGVCSIGAWAMSDDKAKPAADHGHDHAGKPADGASTGGMDPAMMEAWGKYMTPGENHKALENMAGKFSYKMWWKMDPAQPAVETTGTYSAEMIMGGRFLVYNVNGDMMGQPFEGMGCIGYDNSLKKYVSAWIDNMGTGLMRTEGAGDAKEMTFAGEMLDPMTNKMTKYKFSYTMNSPDEFVMRWWSPNPANGEMFESMSITYMRDK